MPLSTAYNLDALGDQLSAAGIPYIGISTDGTACLVSYASSATPAQKAQGDSLASTFRAQLLYRRRFADILSDVATLAANDPTHYAQVVRWVVSRTLQNDPRFTKTMDTTLGLSIAVTTTDAASAD